MAENGATGNVDLPWHEPGERELRDFGCTAVIVGLLMVALFSFYRAATGAGGVQVTAGLIAVGVAVVGWFVWYGPMGRNVGSVVSVDEDGLTVRHRGWTLPWIDATIGLTPPRRLPAGEIGEVHIVAGERRHELWRASMALTLNGRRIGWTHNTIERGTEEAVMVEQRRDGMRRPWWLLRSTDCDGLATALEQAGSRVGGGRS